MGSSLERTKVVKAFTANINISAGRNWSEKKDLDQRGTYALGEFWIKHFRTFDCVDRLVRTVLKRTAVGEWMTFWQPEQNYFTKVKVNVACLRIVMDFVLENFWSAVIYRVVMRCKTHLAPPSFQHQDTVLDVQLARTLFTNLICFCK